MKRLTFDLRHVKHYANEDGALRALNKAFPNLDLEYLFATQDGRIVPVIRLSPDQHYMAAGIAGTGFYVTNK